MSNFGVLALPNEILNHILTISTEPAFIHVCRRTWKELPPFVWYSKRLAALAFYTPVYNHVYSDYPIELFDRHKLPGFQSPLIEEERTELQRQLFCSYWFTFDHLVKTANYLIFSALVEALKMFDIKPSSLQTSQVLQILRRFGQIWKRGESHCHTYECIRWEQPGQYWLADISNLYLQVQGPNELRSGKTLPPWRMGSQIVRAYSLDIPVLPKKLIEMVGTHDKRSFELLKLLYDVRTDRDAPQCLFAMTSATLIAIEKCIELLLRSGIDTVDPNDEHLKLLLLYDGLVDSQFYDSISRNLPFRPIQCSCLMKTDVEKTSIYIRRRYYAMVMDECNTEGFRRLIKLNPAVCLPPPYFFKAIFSDPKISQKPHLQEQRRIYMEAYEKKQVARKQLPQKGKRSRSPSATAIGQYGAIRNSKPTLFFTCSPSQS